MATKKSANQAVLKPHPTNKEFSYLYLKNVPVVYPSIQEPKKKYQSKEMEYAMTAFVNTETREYLESEDVMLNKELFEVGKDKNKKKKIKYQTSDQREDGKDIYDPYVGLHGISLTLNEKTKAGKTNKLIVVDKEGHAFNDLVGNGSVVNVKLFGYRNDDGMLVVSMNLVQVVEHVPYEGGDGTFEDEELGITIDTKEFKEKSPKEKLSDEFDDDVPFDTADDDSDDY